MVSEVRLDPLGPQEVLVLRELLDLQDLREPRDPLVLRDLQGLPEPLQRLLPLHQHRFQTPKVVVHQELQILFHLARSGTQLPMLALVFVMQLNLPLSRHVLSYQKLNMVPEPATQQS
jgi:hypothetical protein